MFPVEPSPDVIGTMASPLTEVVTGLRFLPNAPLAFSPKGAKTLLAAPRAARNVRRLQPSFIFRLSPVRLSLCRPCGRTHNLRAADDFNQRIARNPFERHASARRSFSGRKIGAVNFVQGVVLRFVGIEPSLACWG